MEKQKLSLPDGSNTGFFGIVCPDTGRMVGAPVGDGYTLIDNGQIWDMTEKALAGTDHKIVSCGTVANRSKGFISVKLADNFVAAGRETESVLNIMWGHGGKCAVIARTGVTVIVCANTLAMALSRAGDFNFSIRHTGNALPKLDGMEKAVDAHIGVTAEFQAAMKQFSGQSCNLVDANRIFAGFIVRDDAATEVSTRAGNQIQELVSLFVGGKGNNGDDHSDILNAATDYYTHQSSGGDNLRKQLESSEFGMGAKRKTEMFKLLRGASVPDLGDLDTVIKRGEKIMQLV
jgi:hypothetical protein